MTYVLLTQLLLSQHTVLMTPAQRVVTPDEFAAITPCVEAQWPGVDTTRVYNSKCYWDKEWDDDTQVDVDVLKCYFTTYADLTPEEQVTLEAAGALPFGVPKDQIDATTGNATAVIRRYGPEKQNANALACWDAVALAIKGLPIAEMRQFRMWYKHGQYWASTAHIETKTALEYAQCRAAGTCSTLSE